MIIWLRQFFCRHEYIWKSDNLNQWPQTRTKLECLHCGKVSPGWSQHMDEDTRQSLLVLTNCIEVLNERIDELVTEVENLSYRVLVLEQQKEQ